MLRTYLIIKKTDSSEVRLKKKRFRKRLKRKFKRYIETAKIKNKKHKAIDLFFNKNIDFKNFKNENKSICQIKEKIFSLYNCSHKVLDIACRIASLNENKFSLDFNNAEVGFGALYLIDIIGWYKSREKSWQLKFKNLSKDQTELFLNLRTDRNNYNRNNNSCVVNRHVKIERRKEQLLLSKDYDIASAEIRNLVEKGISELKNDSKYKLDPEMSDAIHSVISEQFDNVYQHAIDSDADLCGAFDKKHKTVSILISNFGPTIAETLQKQELPLRIANMRDNLLRQYRQKGFFGSDSNLTEENILTLLALQEGVSSKIIDDSTRGYGLIDFIEKCFNLSPKTNIVIVSGRTTIKIDEKYNISKNVCNNGIIKRVLSFNNSGKIDEKPDSNYVLNHGVCFPGVIIETTIPIEY